MKFSPLKFQGSLAAAGIALMPFNYLKSTIFKGNGPVTLSNFSTLNLDSYEHFISLFLVAIMSAFIVIHFTITAIFLKELIVWLFKTDEFKGILKNPIANSSLFSPFISLSMTMVVAFGPLSFFVPQIAANIQGIIQTAFILFSLFWVLLLALEINVVKILFTESFEYEKLNFGWLLDVLALGAVSLFGSGIALLSENTFISSLAALMISVTLLVGIVTFAMKISLLFYQMIKSKTMPAVGLIPAYFLLIPPTCLLGFSFFKLIVYAGKTYAIDISSISFLVIVFSYITAITWLILLLSMLKNYLKNKFLSSDFSPAQWGMV